MSDSSTAMSIGTRSSTRKKWILKGIIACVGLAAAVHIGLGLAYYGYSYGFGDVSVDSSFETGDLSEWSAWGAIQRCCDHSMQVVPAPGRPSEKALRFTLRGSDGLVKGSKRVEIRAKAPNFGVPYYHKFRVYLPSDWEFEGQSVTINQWHGVRDAVFLEKGRPPPLAISIRGSEFRIGLARDEKFISPGGNGRWPTVRHKRLWAGKAEAGRWSDWLLKIRWSIGEDGLIEVWKDGKQIVRHEGPNTHNDLIAPYFKFGIYVPSWKGLEKKVLDKERRLYFDDVKIWRDENAQ